MRTSLLSLVLLALSAVSGCGTVGVVHCSDYDDTQSCDAQAACHVITCPSCSGASSFAGCYALDENPPGLCPGIQCPAQCPQLATRQDCLAVPTCEAPGCPDCGGGTTFIGCYNKGQGPIIDCAQCLDCSQFGDEGSCDASSQCHSIYMNGAFSLCGNGPAHCSPDPAQPACGAPTPFCDGDFTVGYSGSCPEGCVRAGACDDCRNSGCPAGETCQLCFASYVCMLDGDVC
jgi:hypothetical protein